MRGPRRANARTGVIVTAVSVAVSFLTVGVPGLGAARTTASSGPSNGSAEWAYGALGVRTWTGSGGTYTYDASVTVGFVVILHETSSSPGNYTLSANRTMGVLLSVKFCKPSCSHPAEEATVDYHAWEVDRAVLDLTTSGNVTLNGTPTRALALVSSSMTIVVGVRESTRVFVAGIPVLGHNASVNVDANTSTAFTPALGLVPLALASGETWNSTSAYVETGAVNWSVLVVLLNGTVSRDATGGIPLAGAGSLSINGSYGGKTVRLAGANYDVLSMSVEGPFSAREGFLFIPTASNIFGSAAPAWLTGTNTSSSSSFSQESVDIATPLAATGSHLGFYGSKIVWSSGTANPASVAPSTGGLAPASAPEAGSANATTVQGGPESLAQATTDQNCLASGLGCPLSGGPKGLLGELLVIAGVAAVVVVAVALVAERRRLPPPPYPNAALYPPGPAAPTAPQGGRRPSPPAPPEDDPLGHLW